MFLPCLKVENMNIGAVDKLKITRDRPSQSMMIQTNIMYLLHALLTKVKDKATITSEMSVSELPFMTH